MKKVFEMKQERANLTASIREMIDKFEGKEMGAEDTAILKKMEADFDSLNNKILTEERQLERERAMGETGKPDSTPSNDVRNMFSAALSGDPNKVAAFQNAIDLGTNATAGFLTAPVDFVEELIKGLDADLFMRRIGTVVGPIGQGQTLGYPAMTADVDDFSWLGEVVAAVEDTGLTFARREFKPNRMNKLLKVSKSLVAHANMADGVVKDRLQYKLGATAEKAYMTGDGSAKPLGVFTANANGITTARDVVGENTATAVTANGLLDVKFAVKQQYRARASWVAHDDFAKQVAKLKGTDGQYIWQPSLQAGQPDMLLGAPVYTSQFAPNTFTANQYGAVYGDFSYYWICDADEINIQVLRELYAANNQVGYLVDYFGDGMPVLAEAFARLKFASA